MRQDDDVGECNRNLYLQNVASYALPGEALRDIGAEKPRSTLQLSLYSGL